MTWTVPYSNLPQRSSPRWDRNDSSSIETRSIVVDLRFFLSQREIRLILAKAQEPYRTWYGLAAESGLRAGELCGLTVDDIDLGRGMLQVRQSAWRGKLGNLGDPKTDKSIRVVELSPQACGHLSKFLESWHPNQHRLLFATRSGTPWDQNLLLKRKFRPLLQALGIQVPRGNGFHAFRPIRPEYPFASHSPFSGRLPHCRRLVRNASGKANSSQVPLDRIHLRRSWRVASESVTCDWATPAED
jgi:integrase